MHQLAKTSCPRDTLPLLLLSLLCFAPRSTPAAEPRAPAPLPGLRYTNEFFPDARYRETVPTQQKVVGFANGDRAATPGEVERCLKAWTAAAPERTRLIEYARSHEGRPLHYVVVTAPRNLERLDQIQSDLARLGDPRKVTEDEAQALIQKLPPVAWLAYTIHGDETEGSDAGLAVSYYLIAAENEDVQKLLADLVIIIDPLMNPDGRERFTKMIAEHRGTSPNIDDQSLVHSGYWPRGRGNHYLFDLNRDSLFAVHPETRGRMREIAKWNPQLFVDAHGMGAQDTHLFSPPREPINPNIPKEREPWGQIFARDQAAAFDRHNLLYYTGEWHEEWYPGYTDAWASYRGALGILYEQARIAEDGVRRPEGRILTYRESLRHHVIGSMANLATLQAHAREMLAYFYQTRRSALANDGPYARRTFAVLSATNHTRLAALADLLGLQGIEVFRTESDFTAATATDQLGRELKEQKIPAGTLLIPNRQPLGRLTAALLEFDPWFSAKALEEERRDLLAKGESRIYDTTAWNLTMMFGLDALTLASELPESAKPFNPAAAAPAASDANRLVAYVIDGADDSSVTAAARLLERGVQVRVAQKAFAFDQRQFSRGSLVVTPIDQRARPEDWRSTVKQVAADLGLTAVAVSSGLGTGELPDIGGDFFTRMEPPRVALIGRERVSPNDFGSSWYVIDHRLGLRHSHLERPESADLSRYNVLVLPDGRAGAFPSNAITGLKEWVKQGGTLIIVGNSIGSFIQEKTDFSRVRALPEVLGRLPEYELAILREWQAHTSQMPSNELVWAHKIAPGLKYPWQAIEGATPEEKELKKRDAWQAMFMPQGALLASRVNTNHWLTFGCGDWLPILAGGQHVLMSGEGVEAPIRYGYLVATARTNSPARAEEKPAAESEGKKDGEKKKEAPRVGWCVLPENTEMYLRMSGLLWPEAGHRLANSAWVTRERLGRGQVILFATPPTFRAGTRGATRVFLNALVYGPGFGGHQPIQP